MSKKKKETEAHDGLVRPEHIHAAQSMLLAHGPVCLMKKLHDLEPELAMFIAAMAKDIAAEALIDSDMQRSIALGLRQRIAGLAINVYGAYHLASQDIYKVFAKGTDLEKLDADPDPTPPVPPMPPIPPLPPSLEEGDPLGF
jgi:hypothetical protein